MCLPANFFSAHLNYLLAISALKINKNEYMINFRYKKTAIKRFLIIDGGLSIAKSKSY